MNDTPLGQTTGDDDDGDGLMLTSETSNEVKGYLQRVYALLSILYERIWII